MQPPILSSPPNKHKRSTITHFDNPSDGSQTVQLSPAYFVESSLLNGLDDSSDVATVEGNIASSVATSILETAQGLLPVGDNPFYPDMASAYTQKQTTDDYGTLSFPQNNFVAVDTKHFQDYNRAKQCDSDHPFITPESLDTFLATTPSAFVSSSDSAVTIPQVYHSLMQPPSIQDNSSASLSS